MGIKFHPFIRMGMVDSTHGRKNLDIRAIIRTRPTDYRQTDKTLGPAKVKQFKQESSDRHTKGRTDGRYQLHYLPRFAVDKNVAVCFHCIPPFNSATRPM